MTGVTIGPDGQYEPRDRQTAVDIASRITEALLPSLDCASDGELEAIDRMVLSVSDRCREILRRRAELDVSLMRRD